MLRSLLLAAAFFLLAGCASPAIRPSEDVHGMEATQEADAPRTSTWTYEGRYEALVVNGKEVYSSGNVHAFDVEGTGWAHVSVRLDVLIESALVLLPPHCSGADAACAVRLMAPGDQMDIEATLPDMAPGTWTSIIELQAGSPGRFGGSIYALSFDYE